MRCLVMAEAKRLHIREDLPVTHRTLVAPNHSSLLLQMLQQMYTEEHLCDYTIIAEGKAFRTHRNVLASVSDYFRVMLTGSMIEARQDHVSLKGVTAHGMKILLDFTYTGQLTLNLDDVVEVLSAACHLQMKSAVELSCDFLLSELSTRTCVDVLNVGEMFALHEVRSAALEHILDHFERVACTENFCKLDVEHVKELLLSDCLRTTSELSLFRHVMKWIEFDPERRARHITDLMECIRFALMKPEELIDHVAQTESVMREQKCRALLDEALRYHVLPNRHPMMQNQRTRVRNVPCMVAFGGRYGINIGYKHNCNKMYAFHHGKWVPLPCSDSNFLYAAVVVVDNFLYVCGGMGKPAHARANCQRFDPRTCTWSRLSQMKTRRQSFPLVSNKGLLYAFGGGTPMEQSLEHPPTDRCEVYSIDRNEWQFISPLPEQRKSSSACVQSDKIYLSGGRTNEETSSCLWCYDPHSDSWCSKTPMPSAHAGHAMLSVGDGLFVIDRTDLVIECYDILADQWSKVCSPQLPITGIARPAILDTFVYCLSYMQDGEDFKCKRINVLTQEVEPLPDYPEAVHCVLGASLTFPHRRLIDRNNNSDSHLNNTSNSTSTTSTSCNS
ncbi:hypothetical protein LSH36_235g00021 [Paralvinella palmiformis]|uniref:BTB domain-containing protein n=1 Tax=Paralvinella palmiformis TaxID=53620 RepID=A0AAD9JMA3_9ANNE|nr:hypothetical protein LSH36_235g00021 [Paralvinella palmiformis]